MILKTIRSLLIPEKPTFEALCAGVCAIPAPPVTVKAPKAPKVEDMDAYLEREETNTWGFVKDSSVGGVSKKSIEGSVANLTDNDVQCLIDRGLWPKGRDAQGKYADAKKAWHKGATIEEISIQINRSISWVEKAVGAFGASLLEESV